MKALVTASFTDEGLDRLRRLADVVYEPWHESHAILRFEELADKVAQVGADVLLVEVDLVHGEVFDRCKLSLIGACRADPLTVSVERATDLGIPVLYTPGRNAEAVAELAVSFMLLLARNTLLVISSLRTQTETAADPKEYMARYEKMRGFELGCATVGLVGLGAVARAVARKLSGFGARVLAYDPYAPEEAFTAVGATRASLEGLLKSADFVSIHCAVTDETRGLIDANRLSLMKRSAYLVNTARPDMVDEDALFAALESRSIAGAGLDLLREEPISPTNRFLALDNALVTPHIGGASHDVVRHQTNILMDDVERWFRGERPRFLANPAVWERRTSTSNS
ncbi:MAG: 3-phosphoglycerate dehydrogenase [Deltaproteobacteria bacterium]|nr:3-phosphoglycerate dehydrogenase [Deltaproteobacteria bacterium]